MGEGHCGDTDWKTEAQGSLRVRQLRQKPERQGERHVPWHEPVESVKTRKDGSRDPEEGKAGRGVTEETCEQHR